MSAEDWEIVHDGFCALWVESLPRASVRHRVVVGQLDAPLKGESIEQWMQDLEDILDPRIVRSTMGLGDGLADGFRVLVHEVTDEVFKLDKAGVGHFTSKSPLPAVVKEQVAPVEGFQAERGRPDHACTTEPGRVVRSHGRNIVTASPHGGMTRAPRRGCPRPGGS